MTTQAAQTHQAGNMRPAGHVFETTALLQCVFKLIIILGSAAKVNMPLYAVIQSKKNVGPW